MLLTLCDRIENVARMDFSPEAALRVEPAYDGEAAFAPREAGEPPFTLIAPIRRTSPLIFASPHSGRRYPTAFLAQAKANLASLRRSEDAYVDEIFAGAAAHGAPILSASVARAYVDLNRDPCELDPDMFTERLPPPSAAASPRVQAGLGAIPKIAGDGQPIYAQKLALADAQRRIALVHRPYHAMLQALIDEARADMGCAVLIDCHSMPSCSRGPNAPDVVLGDRYGAACHPSVTSLAEATLRRLGYRVIRNAPFAGGHTTQHYGRPGRRVHALQIELNRGLYLDEKSMQRTSGFLRVRADMARLGEALAAAELHKSLA